MAAVYYRAAVAANRLFGLNLNYAFDPVHTWRFGQPFILPRRAS